MPLIHRRTILEKKILEWWMERHTSGLYIRYAVTWDDNIREFYEGRIPIEGVKKVGEERIEEER